jgi:L-cystine uptake protein TcyP (sodium:dicarboxylate symporter family)
MILNGAGRAWQLSLECKALALPEPAMNFPLLLNLVPAIGVLGLLYWMQERHWSFSHRVFSALGCGVLLGAALQAIYGATAPIIADTNAYLDIVGTGYVKLLQMIVMPLIMVSIVSAILKLKDAAALGRISALTIGTLMITTMIAALIGILMARLFGLTALGLASHSAEVARAAELQSKLPTAQAVSLPSMILSFLPENPFLDLTGARKTSTIAVVIFALFLGIAATGLAPRKPDVFASIEHAVKVIHALVMRMVTLVLRLTPFGVFALMTQVVASSSYRDILNLIGFVAASYSALALMLGVHLVLVAGAGLAPLRYLKKIFPVLVFGFTSRSSAGTIPMNVQAQTTRLGTPEGIANFAASFGSTIGQNGCAGIYPAMLAVMIAPTVGIDPYTAHFLVPLLGVITVGSVGVAGVGGGATFAALIVLSSMNLPVALAGLLISIEPLIDMGRTAINVSGAMAAGTVTSRLLGQTDMAVFRAPRDAELDEVEQAS